MQICKCECWKQLFLITVRRSYIIPWVCAVFWMLLNILFQCLLPCFVYMRFIKVHHLHDDFLKEYSQTVLKLSTTTKPLYGGLLLFSAATTSGKKLCNSLYRYLVLSNCVIFIKSKKKKSQTCQKQIFFSKLQHSCIKKTIQKKEI